MEIWKNITGYEGIYQVSNYGRIKSLKRKKWNGKSFQIIGEKILKPSINNVGYYVVNLAKNGKQKLVLVHRIVASEFLKNDNNLPVINHKDGNKLNNHVDNLEWTTYQNNNIHAMKTGLNRVKKPIKGINIKTGEEFIFESAREAERKLGVSHKNISACINGRQKTAGDYKWELLSD